MVSGRMETLGNKNGIQNNYKLINVIKAKGSKYCSLFPPDFWRKLRNNDQLEYHWKPTWKMSWWENRINLVIEPSNQDISSNNTEQEGSPNPFTFPVSYPIRLSIFFRTSSSTLLRILKSCSSSTLFSTSFS